MAKSFFLEHGISFEECDKIVSHIDDNLLDKDQKYVMPNEFKTYGEGSFKLFNVLQIDLKILNSLDIFVKQKFGTNFVYTHNFLIIYQNKVFLAPHIDRVGLDLTLTVPLNNITIDWSIFVDTEYSDMSLSKEQNIHHAMNRAKKFVLKKGECVCFEATKLIHWRPYIDLKDQKLYQMMLHWKKI